MDTKIQPVIPAAKRGPYRLHSVEFKRAVVAKSFAEGASVSRVAREFNVNANQVFAWRKQYGAGTENSCHFLPVTVLESVITPPSGANARGDAVASGAILLTVGPAQLRLEGAVDAATLAQVLARLLP